MIITSEFLSFTLPVHLACVEPTEERNLARDDVRLLVTGSDGFVEHSKFKHFADYLQAGDVLIVNTSATVPAAFSVMLSEGRKGRVHFSSEINNSKWLVEVREVVGEKSVRWKGSANNDLFALPGGVTLALRNKYFSDRDHMHLWVAEFDSQVDFNDYTRQFGRPIQYENLSKSYPLDYYQTAFSFRPGSAEMPSAGRGFTQELIDKLLSKGINFAPILLHTGVSSLEEDEPPYPEYVEMDPISAAIINRAKEEGKRVIAVGTTAVRAVESSVDGHGKVVPFQGHTNLYIKHPYQMKVVDHLLTGFHEPKASHLHMLASLAGDHHIENAYAAAIENNYFWHQFGDLHLILND